MAIATIFEKTIKLSFFMKPYTNHESETINDDAIIGKGNEDTHLVLRTSWIVAIGDAQAIKLDIEASDPERKTGSTLCSINQNKVSKNMSNISNCLRTLGFCLE